jgi:hypothetical protein
MIDPSLDRYAGKNFILRAFLAAVVGVTPEEFAEDEIRRSKCWGCFRDFPIDSQGYHYIPGSPSLITARCANVPKPKATPHIPTGRGIHRRTDAQETG